MVPTLLVAALLTVDLTIVLATKAWRPAVAWGALWGEVLGLWILAPRLITADRISLVAPVEWLALLAILVAAFAILGAALTVAAIAPVAWWTASVADRDERRRLAFAIAVPVALAPAYLAGSLGIEAAMLSTVRWPRLFGSGVGLLAAYAAASCLLLWTSRHSMRHGLRLRLPAFAAALAAASVLGAASLPLRATAATSPVEPATTSDVRLAPAPDRQPPAPLLVVGLDSGNWDTLRPLMQSGRLPVLTRLMNTGVSGSVHAEWPPYWSAPAWGAIVTGFAQHEVGVYEDLMVDLPGLRPFEVRLSPDIGLNPINLLRSALVRVGAADVAQHSRDALQRPPVWEALSRLGRRTAVLRFPFTYPASGQADFVIANRIDPEGWEDIGVRPGDADKVVHPASMAPGMRQLFVPHAARAAALLRAIEPPEDWPNPRDARIALRPLLRSVTETDSATIAAAHHVLAVDPGLAVVMLYIGGFDVVCHAFWPYRFPGSYPDDPPASDDVARLGGVIDRYLEHLDAEIGRLIEAFPQAPNVLLVSDHGHVASDDATLWRAWHGPEGVFMASGPDIAGPERDAVIRYADIVPTILSLQGVGVIEGLPGRAVVRPRNMLPGVRSARE